MPKSPKDATIAKLAGECRAFFAFEAAFSIDLARAAARFPASAREALPQSRRLPADADFTQKPLRVVVDRAPQPGGAGLGDRGCAPQAQGGGECQGLQGLQRLVHRGVS